MEYLYGFFFTIIFLNVYYGMIGKESFTPRWLQVNYMGIAPIIPPP